MNSLDVALSTGALADLGAAGPACDFTFVVRDRSYDLPSVAAEFLSPRLRQLHAIDETINEITLAVGDLDEVFENFISLSQGSTVTIDLETAEQFVMICCELEDWDVAALIDGKMKMSVTKDNAIDLLLFHSNISSDFSSEVNLIASHFHEVAAATDRLSISLISEIISDRSPRVESEDWLYYYVMNRMRTSRDFKGLLEFVEFEYLSSSKMSEFINLIWSSASELNISILRGLCMRLMC
jgi:hypothetical protein